VQDSFSSGDSSASDFPNSSKLNQKPKSHKFDSHLEHKKSISNSHHEASDSRVSCSGAKDGSAHPLVYLSLIGKESAVCPYCSRVFRAKN